MEVNLSGRVLGSRQAEAYRLPLRGRPPSLLLFPPQGQKFRRDFLCQKEWARTIKRNPAGMGLPRMDRQDGGRGISPFSHRERLLSGRAKMNILPAARLEPYAQDRLGQVAGGPMIETWRRFHALQAKIHRERVTVGRTHLPL